MTTHFKGSFGGIGLGDITGWSRATDAAKRPLDLDLRRRGHPVAKVKSLDAIRAFHRRREELAALPNTSAQGFVVPVHHTK